MFKSLIFDRDGTIIENAHYPKYPWQIKLKKGIKEKMLKYKNEFKFFLISNQSGVKRGYYSIKDIERIQKFIEELIYPIKFEAVFYCTHHPNENCPCRKPKGYFLKKIIYTYNIDTEQSYFIGDSKTDELLAKSFNIKFIHIQTFLDL
ncbi:MAG: HAD-IIIA family hydrolase [candidate division WOR-3 bacterium]